MTENFPERRSVNRDMPREWWVEEYQAFVRMGLTRQEIARAFRCTMDALEHRMRRNGVYTPE